MMKRFAVGLLSGVLMISVGHALPWGKKTAPVQTQQGVGNPVPQQGVGMPGMQNRLPISMQPRPMGQGGGTCPALPMKDFTSLLTKGMVVSNGVNLKKVSMNKGGAGKQILSFFGKQKDYPGRFVSAAQVNGVVATDHITLDPKTGGTQVPNAGFCVYQHNPGKVAEFLLAAISTEPVGTPPKSGPWGQIASQVSQQVKGVGQNTAQQLVGVGQNTLQQGMMTGQNMVQNKLQPYVQPQQQMPQQQMNGYNQQMPQQPQQYAPQPQQFQGGYPNQGQYPQGDHEHDQYGGQEQYQQGGNEYDQYGGQEQYHQDGNEHDQYGGQEQYPQGGNEYDQYGGQEQYQQGGNEYDQYGGGQEQYQQQGNDYNQQYGY